MATRKRSTVWLYFDHIDQNPSKVKCQACGETVQHSGNTSNMLKHLKKKHPVESAEIEAKRKEDATASTSAYESPKAKSLTSKLLKMIAVDLQPLSIVDDQGFREFAREMDPRYVLPSRRSLVRTDFPQLFQRAQSDVKSILTEVSDRDITLTTDLWTSRAGEAYMSLTCHYISKDWKFRSHILSTSHLPGEHTAHAIAEKLTTEAEEWGISEKIQAIVTDNGANMVAGVRVAGFKQIPCFAHSLNLVVQDSLNSSQSVGPILQKCNSVVTYFHHSTKAMDKLREIQQQINLPMHKLINSVVTRWNSVFYMLERIVEQNQAITTALCVLGRSTMCLCEEELEKIKDMITALRPYEEVTRELSAEKFVSISKVIPLSTLLLTSSSDLSKKDNEVACQLAQQCKKRFMNIEQNYPLAASTWFDPRFKSLTFKNNDNIKVTKEKIIHELQKMKPVPAPTDLDDSPAVPPEEKGGIWTMFDQAKKKNQEQRTSSSMVDAHIEMRMYGDEQLMSRETDPLEWWRSREECLKFSSKLARKYLGIVATSVPSERLFSKAGQLISDRRASLKPKNVNMLLFLNDYLNQ
ncbi:hypothetical protein Pmani_001306 [Petrolisthes manimaculis]|uniref:BED-type domain-containing protein n=2 Tax=Petrolisthes manimaculis TaxID=1843537 RepID=A0AAE1UPJ2_9EUCA|nr:hypothetical protein Pmani_001306 [Petrolisthes manimaculis]